MDPKLKTKLLTFLRKNDLGSTIQELSKELNLERHTLTKYLESLKAEKLVECREVGRTKLWLINKAPLFSLLNTNNEVSESFKELLNNLDEKIYLVSRKKEVIWVNDKVKSLKAKKCFENFNQSSSCQNCPAERSFVTGNKEVEIKGNVQISTVPIKDINGETVAFLELVKQR